jgi:hypothetical protein
MEVSTAIFGWSTGKRITPERDTMTKKNTASYINDTPWESSDNG